MCSNTTPAPSVSPPQPRRAPPRPAAPLPQCQEYSWPAVHPRSGPLTVLPTLLMLSIARAWLAGMWRTDLTYARHAEKNVLIIKKLGMGNGRPLVWLVEAQLHSHWKTDYNVNSYIYVTRTAVGESRRMGAGSAATACPQEHYWFQPACRLPLAGKEMFLGS